MIFESIQLQILGFVFEQAMIEMLLSVTIVQALMVWSVKTSTKLKRMLELLDT